MRCELVRPDHAPALLRATQSHDLQIVLEVIRMVDDCRPETLDELLRLSVWCAAQHLEQAPLTEQLAVAARFGDAVGVEDERLAYSQGEVSVLVALLQNSQRQSVSRRGWPWQGAAAQASPLSGGRRGRQAGCRRPLVGALHRHRDSRSAGRKRQTAGCAERIACGRLPRRGGPARSSDGRPGGCAQNLCNARRGA